MNIQEIDKGCAMKRKKFGKERERKPDRRRRQT